MKWPSLFVCVASLLSGFAPAQESAAPFDAPLVTIDQRNRYGVTLDLDNDGYMDAVSWWWGSDYVGPVRIKGWHNDGTGKLSEVWSMSITVNAGSSTPPSSGSTLRMSTCNLDSDGLTDIYFVTDSYGLMTFRALRMQGLQPPEVMSQYSYGVGGDVSEIHAVVTDFTGDGFADLAISVDGNLRFREFVAGQTYLADRSSTYPFAALQDIKALITLNANGDSTPDVCVMSGSTVKVIEVQDCLPVATQTFTQGIVADHMPAAGDIDGDGDEDIVIWDMSRYSVLRRTGTASWSVEALVTGGPAEQLFDVDQDGDLDGVCCGGGGGYTMPDNVVPSTMRVSLNDGTGAFAPAIEKNWLGSDHLAGIADLDHDGDLDVVSGRCILYARGPLTDVLHPRIGTGVKVERAMVDFDGDADPDFGFGLGAIERNLGEGLCAPHDPVFPEAPLGTHFAGPGWPGDFDRDGDFDLVVRWMYETTFATQRLLLNLGGGTFVDGGDAGAPGQEFNPGVANGDAPESSLAIDSDGDGDADLLTRSCMPGTTPSSRFWWNDGSGHFSPGPEFPGERVHAIVDFNRDDLPDLVTVTTTVGVRFGLGAGAFGPRTEFAGLDPHTGRLAAQDLDGDGDRDIAFMGPSYLQFYWNDGLGTFTNEQFWQVSIPGLFPGARRVWCADVNADGRLDVLVTPARYEVNGFRIVLRNADNTGFEAPFSQIVYDYVGAAGVVTDAVLRDVDGDGDIDFVSDRLVRNGTYGPPDGGRRRQLVETGWPGAGGLVPVLGADGPFRVGEAAELRITNACGGASGLMTVAWAADPQAPFLLGGRLVATQEPIYAQLSVTTSGTPLTAGTGSWHLPYTVPGYAAGRTKRYLAEIYDPGSPIGVSRTNAMLITYGP